jgi:hypothetical protein
VQLNKRTETAIDGDDREIGRFQPQDPVTKLIDIAARIFT